ncbi:DNA adenine methylase [Herminiimonas aquatilis]|uniref:site-specific DNA-methyltransferase (adenine-specific) n=1 Tax=Herminiimonas aquatilis TaxID=345342 RepID=A0ABW2J438_9BURK
MWREWPASIVTDNQEQQECAQAKTTIEGSPEGFFRPYPFGLEKKGDGIGKNEVDENKPDLPSKTDFPTTRYYGSKRKQLSWLRNEFASIKGETALDAFGGTGAVSHLLQDLGWHTTYNDVFQFNTISARALFSGATSKFSKFKLVEFLKSIQPQEGFISKTFEGIYFTREENMWLDGCMMSIKNQRNDIRELILFCVFQACLKKRPFNLFHRANLDLRQSTVPVKFGNRSTWNKSFTEHIVATYTEVEFAHQRIKNPVKVIDAGCATSIDTKFDLIYIDPPYFKKAKKNTETYLARYHFLEGLARYDEWGSLIDPTSPQKVILQPFSKEWTNKNDLMDNLRHMFNKHVGSKFVMSYVANEEPTEQELFDLFRINFDRVQLSRRSFTRALSKKQSFEILLIGQ